LDEEQQCINGEVKKVRNSRHVNMLTGSFDA